MLPLTEQSTPKQRDFITDLVNDCKFTAAEEKAYYLNKTGRVILTLADISRKDASAIINELKIRRDHVWANYIPPPIGIEHLVVTETVETVSVEEELVQEELVYETTGPPPWD